MKYRLNHRLSFMRFQDLGLSDTLPDQNTIWLFKENFIKANVVGELFKKFEFQMEKEGMIVKEGRITEQWNENPTTLQQKEMYQKKSKIRARNEHVFGFITKGIRTIFIRTIGKVRARATIGLMNLTYNISLYLHLPRMNYEV